MIAQHPSEPVYICGYCRSTAKGGRSGLRTLGLITQDEVQAPPKPPPSTPTQREEEPVAGQTTAIVTGVVSIAFGVRSRLRKIITASVECPSVASLLLMLHHISC